MLVLSGLDWHGTPMPVPGHSLPIHCGLYSEDYLRVAVDLLRQEFELPGVEKRITVLSGSNEILMFTNWCREQGLVCREEFRIQRIQLTGFYLTSRWRKRLEEEWGAIVIDRYSMSEHFGGGTSICNEDGFRFDPHIVYELVDFSGNPLRGEEPGMLLLTSLYPFVQAQPLIRYWTGDVVARAPAVPGGAPSFRFLGREKHALFHPARPNEVLVTGVDAIEALDAFPEVNRTVNFPQHNLRFASADGFPIFRGTYRLVGGRLDLTLLIETTVPTYLFAERGRELERGVRGRLLERCKRLASYIESGEALLSIAFVSPGELRVAISNEVDKMNDGPRVWAPAHS